ncbi:MAG: hypothetical protein ACRCVT_12540 [Leadbetterella sp.]
MKKKVGIGLLIILNLAFVYIMIMGAIFSFEIVAIEVGKIEGYKMATQITNDILLKLTFGATFVLFLNYLLIKKMVQIKGAFLVSLIITLIGIGFFIPFLLSTKKSFLDYQMGVSKLQHFIHKETIEDIQITTNTNDSILVNNVDGFVKDISTAKHIKGIWKYAKKVKIKIKRTDGSKDSLYTNGKQLIDYNGEFFDLDQNVIEKYLINRQGK